MTHLPPFTAPADLKPILLGDREPVPGQDEASCGRLLVVELASALVLAVAGVDEFAMLLDGFGFALDRPAAAGTAVQSLNAASA